MKTFKNPLLIVLPLVALATTGLPLQSSRGNFYMKTSIYTLTCPITNEIKYVGKTKCKLSTRLSYHCAVKVGNITKVNWIRELKQKGLKPIIEELDLVDDNLSDFHERFWIHQLKNWGFILYNQFLVKSKTYYSCLKNMPLGVNELRVMCMPLTQKSYSNLNKIKYYLSLKDGKIGRMATKEMAINFMLENFDVEKYTDLKDNK